MMKKRDNLYKRFRRTGHSHFRIKYKQIRNKLTKMIRITKGKYEFKIIKRSRNNRKIFYSHVNSKNRKGGGKKIRYTAIRAHGKRAHAIRAQNFFPCH